MWSRQGGQRPVKSSLMSFVGSYVTATYADFKALTIILLIELSQTIVLHRNYQLE